MKYIGENSKKKGFEEFINIKKMTR